MLLRRLKTQNISERVFLRELIAQKKPALARSKYYRTHRATKIRAAIRTHTHARFLVFFVTEERRRPLFIGKTRAGALARRDKKRRRARGRLLRNARLSPAHVCARTRIYALSRNFRSPRRLSTFPGRREFLSAQLFKLTWIALSFFIYTYSSPLRLARRFENKAQLPRKLIAVKGEIELRFLKYAFQCGGGAWHLRICYSKHRGWSAASWDSERREARDDGSSSRHEVTVVHRNARAHA